MAIDNSNLRPVYCPACGIRVKRDEPLFYGGFMCVCFNCGIPFIIRSDWKVINVEPFDPDGDPQIEGIIRYNYHLQRQQRGLE